MIRVLVAMSGGVDSSVAAAILKQSGYDVTGVTMKIWDGGHSPERITRGYCYGPEEDDINDARMVAQTLDIPLHVFDLTSEYRAEVLDYVCAEYLSGRTPNPCVRCNHKIKLDGLLRKAVEAGIRFDFVATGHYARVEWDEERRRYLLKKARDETKDQSYFLFALSQPQLGRCVFPLGEYTKKAVRKIAADLNLGLEEKPESQDFIAGGYSSLLGARARPGPILNSEGEVLGQHKGLPFYTVGQRKKLGLATAEPLYVIAIEQGKNAVIVGTNEEIFGSQLVCADLNWIAIDELREPVEVKAKIRYSMSEAEAVVALLDSQKAIVKFKEPQRAITPGQAVVFYQGDLVLGGGIIEVAGN